MRIFDYCIFLAGLILSVLPGRARGADITHSVSEIVLSSGEVECIVEDGMGMMWFGTTTGLVRFDGYQCKTYYTDLHGNPLFSSNHIQAMACDHRGNLWIATSKSLSVFDPQTLSVECVIDDIPSQLGILKSILVTRAGRLLLGATTGLYRYDEAQGRFLLVKAGYVMTLFEDSSSRIWVGTWGSGFYAYDAELTRPVQFGEFDSLNLQVTGFEEDRNHRIWVCTWDNYVLLRLDNPDMAGSGKLSYKAYPISSNKGNLTSSVMFGITYDEENDALYVATAKGLFCLQGCSTSDYFTACDPEVFGNKEVLALYKNSQDILWASVLGEGVVKVNLSLLPFYNLPVTDIPDASNTVSAIYEASPTEVWLGTRMGVMAVWDRRTGEMTSYREHPQMCELDRRSNAVIEFIRDSVRGLLWIATRYDGVYCLPLKSKSGRLLRAADTFPSRRKIKDISLDGESGRLYVLGVHGIYVLTLENGGFKFSEVDLKRDDLECICTYGGYVWAGTSAEGLLRYDGSGTVKRYDLGGSLPNNEKVLCLYVDSHQTMWVGSSGGGLSRYNKDQDRFDAVEIVNASSDRLIYSIVEDPLHNLWLATGRGVVRVPLDNMQNVKLYTRMDGLANTQFMPGAIKVLSDSTIVIGGYNGLDVCKIPSDSEEVVRERPLITELSVMNIPMEDLVDQGELESPVMPPYVESLRLRYNQNNVNFGFSCLSYNPQAIRYAYRLEGVDNGWIYVDSGQRYVSYNHLSPGIYTFAVKACGSGAVWSDETTMRIVVLSPPWKTWWAYTLYVLVLGSVGFVLYRMVKKRIRLQNALKIEQIERAKTEEVNQAKLKFFTNISHELFTPLSVLQCSIDGLRQNRAYDETATNIMQLNVNRLKRLLQQILEFRKSEMGNLKLRVSDNEIVSFVRRICNENFSPILHRKDITLNFQSAPETIHAFFDIDKLDKIMYNLLSNALKYNYEGGIISVTITEQAEEGIRYVMLKVENTGHGIPAHRMPMLFKRFYEGDYRRFKTQGTGIGLSLTKDLVDLHHGRIEVESVVDETTIFRVMIPADKASYRVEELEEEVPAGKPAEGEPGEPNEPGNQPYLLLVEDDADLLTVMTKVLMNFYEVIPMDRAEKALAYLCDGGAADIVVTDYVMPQMSGVELCRKIRSDDRINHLPIILLTAKIQTEDKLAGYGAGADVYLVKPIEMNVLIAQIRVLLNNRRLVARRYQERDSLVADEVGMSAIDAAFIKRAQAIVEQNIENDTFSVNEFCKSMSMSSSTLYRKLKALTDLSPNEFIVDVRIKKACELLKAGGYQISEIAFMVGFSDPKYFSLVFKKHKGMSPRKYAEGGSDE